ncbi:hypothetical protein Gotur_024177 [Gossypium turneri]
MEKEFLGKVEDNAAVRVCLTQNNLQDLKEIWDQWNNEMKQLFYSNYGDLPYLLDIKVDKHLFRALTQYWNPTYSCFTFGKVDLVPTVEEYMTLLQCPKVQVDKAYSRAANVSTFLKKLMNITGMNVRKRVNVFTLSIYGLVVFPKALGHVDEAVEKVSYQVFSENYSPLKELVTTPRRDDVSEEKWIMILQNLQEEDIEWRAPWMIPNEILYRCGDFDWVPLLGIWRAVEYAPLLVLGQYRSRMKILAVSPMTTPEYSGWCSKRDNDNIPGPREGYVRSIEEHLQVVLSELEIIKQDFEKRSFELGKRIEQLEEEKMRLGLDVDIHKLEAEKLRKRKNTIEEDLDSLKTDYKKLRL